MNGTIEALVQTNPLIEGGLEWLSLSHLLQALSHGEPCEVLLLAGTHMKGYIWLADQKIIRVQAENVTGREAFLS